MPKLNILLRPSCADQDEIDYLKYSAKFVNLYTNRGEIPPNELVVGRYSVVPYYDEVVEDLKTKNCFLINTLKQHRWITDFSWYYDLKGLGVPTPTTYFDLANVPDKKLIVKGKVTSKKWYWNKLMYAKNKKRAVKIWNKLMDDEYIGRQGVVFREYVPLETYEVGINKIPFTNEWRFFCYKNEILCFGYYWSCADKVDYKSDVDCINFVRKVSKLISERNFVSFYVLDIAKTRSGEWILIEVNDGQQSGLSECKLDVLYRNLYNKINNIQPSKMTGERIR